MLKQPGQVAEHLWNNIKEQSALQPGSYEHLFVSFEC